MRLAQTDASVEEERVIGLSRRLGDRQGSGMSKSVVVADQKRVESVLWIEREFARIRVSGVGLSFRCGLRRFRQRSFSIRALANDKLDAECFSSALAKRIVNEIEIIVLQPNLRKIIGNLQSEDFAVNGNRANRREP